MSGRGSLGYTGPKTYTAMRKRVEAARERDGAVDEAGDGPPDAPAILRSLTSAAPCSCGHDQRSHKSASTGEVGYCRGLNVATLAPCSCRAFGAQGTLFGSDATVPDGEVVCLATFSDATGGLHVEHDTRDGRYYITAAFDDQHAPVEVPPAVARGVASVLATHLGTVGEAADIDHAVKHATAAVKQGMTADVENDGDRGPVATLDRAVEAQRARRAGELLAAASDLHVDEIRLLVWCARQLPAERLRAACEAATATGWCGTHASDPTVRRTREDSARSSWLSTVRDVQRLLLGDGKEIPRRLRDEVLADEVERRAIGGEP